MARVLRLTAITLALLTISSASFAAERSAKPVKWVRGIYVAETPASQGVPSSLLWAQAEARAAAFNGITLRGQGQSMLPLYQPGTVLVVAPVKFDELRRGQTVIYTNSEQRSVAHVLVAKCKTGWRVAGLNNRMHDGEGVTAENLFGVVVEAYHADPHAKVTAVAGLAPRS